MPQEPSEEFFISNIFSYCENVTNKKQKKEEAFSKLYTVIKLNVELMLFVKRL